MPTTPSSFQKQSYEEFSIEVKFDKQMASSETITTQTATATLNGVDVSSTIIASSSISGQSVIVGIKGGINGNDYKITTKIVTDAALPDGTYAKYESDIIMAVREE